MTTTTAHRIFSTPVASVYPLVCGARVQEIEDPLMQQIRYLDKLVDELGKVRPLE